MKAGPLLSLMFLSVLGSPSSAQTDRTERTVIELGTLGDASSTAFAINNRGQVVGENVTSQGHSRAFLWQDGVTTPLDESAGSSSAHGINARGDIAGQILPVGAMLWTR